jgi:Rieske Fe-S protein
MNHETHNGPENRRSFLGFLIFGIGAIFSAILGVPIVLYFIDPRHRKGPASAMKIVDGVKLDELVVNTPAQGVVRDRRMDGWTLYPNDVIGRVWVMTMGPRPAGLNNKDAVHAFNRDAARKRAFLMVFSTICPHLGCSINAGGPAFTCPCHAATFNSDGKRSVPASNPAQRGMDILDWEIDEDDPEFNRIMVTYKRYRANDAKKIPVGGGEEETPNN